MVVIGTSGNGGVGQADAYCPTPISLFKGTPTIYGTKGTKGVVS
jgi:hypothetical protein